MYTGDVKISFPNNNNNNDNNNNNNFSFDPLCYNLDFVQENNPFPIAGFVWSELI